MPFERYKTKSTRLKNQYISISPSGSFYLGKVLCIKYRLSNYKYVELYYDTEKKVMGIVATNEISDGIVRLTQRKTGTSCFSGKGFMNYYDIMIPVGGTHSVEVLSGRFSEELKITPTMILVQL